MLGPHSPAPLSFTLPACLPAFCLQKWEAIIRGALQEVERSDEKEQKQEREQAAATAAGASEAAAATGT